MKRCLSVTCMTLSLVSIGGCEVFHHVTCVPTVMVEACMQEAWPATEVGHGPYCTALNNWLKAHNMAFGGGPALSPPPPSPDALLKENP